MEKFIYFMYFAFSIPIVSSNEKRIFGGIEMLVEVFGMVVEKNEVDYWIAYIRQNMRDELREAVYQESGERSFTTHIIFQDKEMISGTFETKSGKKGSFSLLKSLTPCPVVCLHWHTKVVFEIQDHFLL